MTEANKDSEPGIYGYGDIRDSLPLMFGIGMFGLPVTFGALTIKIVDIYTNQNSNGISTPLLVIGLIEMAVGGYAEIRRRQFLNPKK